MTTPSPSDSVSACGAFREIAVQKFELAWLEGARPCVDDYLAGEGTQRQRLLLELVHADLEFRLKASEPARVEQYLERYPTLADDSEAVVSLIAAEYEQRRRFESDLHLDEYRDRFSDHYSALLSWRSSRSSNVSTLSRYELLDVIGRGGCGVVYRARDVRLNRFVAVKLPRFGGLFAKEESDRFLREARSAARLSHPNIVRIYDWGEAENACFIVSEYVDGRPLAYRPIRTPNDWKQIAQLIAAVASALGYAHDRGVIHRDLKPSNILVDATGQPHLTDFGLAKLLSDDATLTQDGQMLGTPAYMSPEQAAGESATVDARTDIYSLGVILYELLTGERPFEGPNYMLPGRIMEDDPPAPRRMDQRIPRDLENICLKAMAKSRSRRYATACEFAADLRSFALGLPVQARPMHALERSIRWCRRRPGVAGLIAAVVATTAVGFAGVVWQWRAAEAQRRQLREGFSEAFSTLETTIQLSINRRGTLATKDIVLEQIVDTVQPYYRRFLTTYGGEEEFLPEVGRAHLALATLLQSAGHGSESLEHFRAGADCYERLLAGPPDATADYYLAHCYFGIATENRRMGNRDSAMEYYRRTAEWNTHARCRPLPEHRSFRATISAESYWYLAEDARHSGRLKESLDLCLRSRALWHEVVSLDKSRDCRRELAKTYFLAAALYRDLGSFDQALDSWSLAAELLQALVTESPEVIPLRRDLAATFHSLGNVHRELGSVHEAIENYREAIRLRNELINEAPGQLGFHGDIAGTWDNLSDVLNTLGLKAESRDAVEQAARHRQLATGLQQSARQ